jgi:arabinogalactan endo-1,4-beta-galactosidase
MILPGMLLIIAGLTFSCSRDKKTDDPDNGNKVFYTLDEFCMGADLSYVNQILDHNGKYRDSGVVRDPYKIFRDNGTNLVRLRLWHNPVWTKDVYGAQGTQLYNDIKDVERSISSAKANGMAVLLDFHYSDTWADPGKQIPPDAWKDITQADILEDSIYNYTSRVLSYLRNKDLLPEMVQIGNEINCGMLVTGTAQGFPELNCCDGHWAELGGIINAGIRAVRDISADITSKPLVLLHVADPKNVTWWFDHISTEGNVNDFDVIGFSYYPLWHTEIGYYGLPALVRTFKSKYNKKIMILETAYPWTTENADAYNNLFGSQTPVGSFAYTKEGQRSFMLDFTQKMMEAGASGIVYWEPAWITSQAKDLWGTGSSWDNSTLFDFEGNTLPAFEYMTYPY